MIELAFRFSDPTADGPTIQRSSERALKNNPSMAKILALVRRFRRHSELPLILFGYFNPFFHYGLESFCRQAAAAGADGVLCVDLPPEESGELKQWSDALGLDVIFLLSPTSGPDRIRQAGPAGSGFIYYVSCDGRHRRAPVLTGNCAARWRGTPPRRFVASGRRIRHFDTRTGGVDRRLRRRGGGGGSALVQIIETAKDRNKNGARRQFVARLETRHAPGAESPLKPAPPRAQFSDQRPNSCSRTLT